MLAAFLVATGCESSQRATEPPRLPPPHIISGSLSVPSACAAATAPDHPAEPSLAVDPTNPRQLVATWLEQRAPDDIGHVVAVSRDGGKSWARSLLPTVVACTGGRYVRTSDPWVSIGRDGTVYVAALAIGSATSAGINHDIVVSVSRDHGSSWEGPVVVHSGTSTQPDKETVFADPRRAGVAYVVWAEYPAGETVEPSTNQVFFARTSDGGRTWSSPAAIYIGKAEAQQNQLLMTAGGVLLDVFVEGSLPGTPHPPPLPEKIRVLRSTDQGQSWSPPIDAATFTYTNAVDPGTAAQLRFFGQDITAAVSGNAVYVGWFEVHSDFSSILVARSEDGGLKWRTPQVVVRERAAAFLPTLAVAGDATVGVLWYDFRHFQRGSKRLDTDVWFSTSRDRGAHWTLRYAAGPFDLRSAPAARFGPFIGDYMGLVGLPDGFAAAFVQAKPQSHNGPTDVFFSNIPSR